MNEHTMLFAWIIGYLFTLGASVEYEYDYDAKRGVKDRSVIAFIVVVGLFIWPVLLGSLWLGRGRKS